jgi:hypothetical protein
VFKSSEQYRAEKNNSYYEKMAEQSMEFIAKIKAANAPKVAGIGEQKNVRIGANAKA